MCKRNDNTYHAYWKKEGKNPHKFQRTFAILNISTFLGTALLTTAHNDHGSKINTVILKLYKTVCIHYSSDNNMTVQNGHFLKIKTLYIWSC